MKSVYTGGEKVAEFESYDELRVGGNKPAFVYEGSELVYPNPVKDGLVLWYDFSGRTNADSQRGIAEDLSDNGNDGQLHNFNFTEDSGYVNGGLKFDGVDDYVDISNEQASTQLTVSIVVNPLKPDGDMFLINTNHGACYLRLERGRIGASVLGIDSPVSYLLTTYQYEVGTPINIDFLIKNDGSFMLYIDGVFQGDKSGGRINHPYIVSGIGRYTAASPRNFDGEVYSTKIYNRPLSAEEIAHNYAIEKERFGIE